MDKMVWVILGLAAYGALCLLVFLKRLIFGDKRKKKLEAERMEASMKELEQQEYWNKRDETQNKIIDLQKQMISAYEEKLSFVESPVLPRKWDGFTLVYEYDLVPIYIPNQEAFEKLEVGCKPTVCQDKKNKFDDRAVSLNLNGEPLAYLRRGNFQDMANDFLEREDGVVAFITYLNRRKSSGQILLGFYRNPINAHLDAEDDCDDEEWEDEEE